MRILTAEEMRLADSTAINTYKIPGVVLMENAGRALADEAVELAGGAEKKYLIIAGGGNNGGDGFVAARHLLNRGAQVRLFLTSPIEKFKGDALINYQILQKLGLDGQVIEENKRLNVLKIALLQTDLIIDCVFGTGLNSVVRGLYTDIFDLINASNVPILACDIPSGLSADSGRPLGKAVCADRTVTFAYPKLGLCLPEAASYVGELKVIDISLPHDMAELADVRRELLDDDFCRLWLRPRDKSGHKGNYGHLLMLAGSPDMPGAAILAAKGALRSGVGLLSAALPQGARRAFSTVCPEVMFVSAAENADGVFTPDAAERICDFTANALLVGPGLGSNPDTKELVRSVIANYGGRMVIDADGLNALVGHTELLAQTKKPPVITPHPGEMARLCGLTVAEVQSNRVETALTYARKWQTVLVLKGAGTLIADPEGRLFVNPTGNAGMATGGSGDVLAGVIGALLAQNLPTAIAAALGVYLHGKAGDLAAAKSSKLALSASMIAGFLPQAHKQISELL